MRIQKQVGIQWGISKQYQDRNIEIGIEMGTSSYNKDSNVDLYVSTNKQYYVAGEYVEGEVYLNMKCDRKYSNLCLKLEGVEYVRWSTGSGKNRRTHSNTYKSYEMHNLLVDFHGNANQGQYLFPFSLLLPAMMAGSFLYSQCCYIKYILKAELVHPTEDNDTQRFEMHLNIVEPPRMPLGGLSITNNVNSQCCGCCADYGTISVGLTCSKNFVLNGDSIQISGIINNTQGKEKIESWRLVLEQRRLMISSGGRTRDSVDNSYIMHQTENVGEIQPGAVREFNVNGTIPHSIVNYTAIGRVVSRYFLLHLYTEYGCCTNTAQAVLHLIVHSRTPMIVQKIPMPPPANWNPQVYPKIVCTNMKPYVYSPLPQIQFLNMPGNNNVIINTNQDMQTEQTANYGYQQASNDFKPPAIENQFLNYNPVYYNQEIFTEAEKQQQGYQPYFVNQSSDNQLIRKL